MAGKKYFPIKTDKWNSRFFKTRVANIEISGKRDNADIEKRLSSSLNIAKAKKISFLIVKIIHPEEVDENNIEKIGLRKYGESIDLVFKYSATKNVIYAPIAVRPFIISDRAAIMRIARSAFRLSYLYKCGLGKKRDIDYYHAVWVKNLTADKKSHVFVAEKYGKVIGFVALNVNLIKKISRIRLIAVDKTFRKTGAGSALMRACIDWGRGKLMSIYVKTQKDNLKALGLYRKMLFKKAQSEKIFCKKLI